MEAEAERMAEDERAAATALRMAGQAQGKRRVRCRGGWDMRAAGSTMASSVSAPSLSRHSRNVVGFTHESSVETFQIADLKPILKNPPVQPARNPPPRDHPPPPPLPPSAASAATRPAAAPGQRPPRPVSAGAVSRAAREARLALMRTRPSSASSQRRSQQIPQSRSNGSLISAGAGPVWVASQSERPAWSDRPANKPAWESRLTVPAWSRPPGVPLRVGKPGRLGLGPDDENRHVLERMQQRQHSSSAGLADPRDPQPDSKAKGAQYAKHIASHLAHGALGRVLVQRERYVDWATTLLQSLQTAELDAAAGAPPAADAPVAGADGDGESACTLLSAKREELLSILATLCIVTVHLAEQIHLWRRALNEPHIVPMWHGVVYPRKALTDLRALVQQAHAMRLLMLTPSTMDLLPLWDVHASAKGSARLGKPPRGDGDDGDDDDDDMDDDDFKELLDGDEPNQEAADATLMRTLPRRVNVAFLNARNKARLAAMSADGSAEELVAQHQLIAHVATALPAEDAPLGRRAFLKSVRDVPRSIKSRLSRLELAAAFSTVGIDVDDEELRPFMVAVQEREAEAAAAGAASAAHAAARRSPTSRRPGSPSSRSPSSSGRSSPVNGRSSSPRARRKKGVQFSKAAAACDAAVDAAAARWMSHTADGESAPFSRLVTTLLRALPRPPRKNDTAEDEAAREAAAAAGATSERVVSPMLSGVLTGRLWIGAALGVAPHGQCEEAEEALRAWVREGGRLKEMPPRSEEEVLAGKPMAFPPHPPPLPDAVLPGPGAPEPPLSTAGAQVAMFAVGALTLTPRELLRVIHSSEGALRTLAASTASAPDDEVASDDDGDAATYIEISAMLRTPADAIDVHMRRRVMVGLHAAPPRLTPLERACHRGLKAVHQLVLGAALFIQFHVRCALALKRHLYTTHRPENFSATLPSRYADALLGGASGGDGAADGAGAVDDGGADDVGGGGGSLGGARAERRLSATQKRVLREWRVRLDPERLVRNEDTFLAPLVLQRRRHAATKLQSSFRRLRAMRWKTQAVSARKVQRSFRSHVNRARMVEVRRQAIDFTQRAHQAEAFLAEELDELEARCQPRSDTTVSPALRALALIRGRVLDSSRSRIEQLVHREVERVTPHALTRLEIKGLVQMATMGLFPEVEELDEVDLDDVDEPAEVA